MSRKLLVALCAAATMALAAAPAAHAKDIKIDVLSSKPNQVSGGDALISITSKDGGLNAASCVAQRARSNERLH